MLVSMEAFEPAGWLKAACVQLASGGVNVVALLPQAIERTSRLPCVTPVGSVMACEVTEPDELTEFFWTRVILMAHPTDEAGYGALWAGRRGARRCRTR